MICLRAGADDNQSIHQLVYSTSTDNSLGKFAKHSRSQTRSCTRISLLTLLSYLVTSGVHAVHLPFLNFYCALNETMPLSANLKPISLRKCTLKICFALFYMSCMLECLINLLMIWISYFSGVISVNKSVK